MDFLIFSDSHGRSDAMQAAIDRQLHAPDSIFFLGDGLRDAETLLTGRSHLFSVRGNCDFVWDPSIASEQLLPFGEHKILITHGHLFGVKSGLGGLIAHAAQLGADITLFGHTHQPLAISLSQSETPLGRPMYLFNPGSIGYDGSFGTLTLRGENVLLSHGRI